MLNESCGTVQGKLNCGGQVAFVFKLPIRQVEFSGLFLILWRLDCNNGIDLISQQGFVFIVKN